MPLRPFSSTILAATSRGSRALTTRSTAGTAAVVSKPTLLHTRITLNAPVHSRTMATQDPIVQSQSQPLGASGDSSGTSPSFESIGIKNTNINCAEGVNLTERQKVLTGSVLDLFGGNPTLKHFSLWQPEATFSDPLTVAQGHAKYTAQFYGLPALFRPIEIQRHRVVSGGDPIELELSNKYVVKGIRKEQVVDSVVRIHVGADGRIERLEDRWNGKLPEGAISEAFRKLNAVTVPTLVKVPKTEEEDMKMKAEREQN